MAPPSPRRPGFSRRAQYSIFASYVIAVIGAVFALLLVLTSKFDPAGHAALQSLASDITSPISRVARDALAGMGSVGETISAYFDAASKNKAMSKELFAARRQLIQGQVDAAENKRLKKMIGMIEPAETPVVAARLVSSSATSSRRYATLAAGQMHGVAVGQPVRTEDGLVGRVIQVGQISSRVLLIIDGKHSVPAKRASDNIPADIVGTGDGRLVVRSLSAGENPFKPGDVFVTSGVGGIYRPGIPVARVNRKTNIATYARPIADPAAYDFARVELPFVAPPPLPKAEAEAAEAEARAE